MNYAINIPTQKGFVLLAALVFMLVMTLIGLAVSNSTSVEERIARNARDHDVAFAAAEAAIRDAKMHLGGTWQWPASPLVALSFSVACTNGLCDSVTTPRAQPLRTLDFYAAGLPGANAVVLGAVTGTPAISGVFAAPRYMLELVEADGFECGFRKTAVQITAQAQGRFDTTRVVLQEIYQPNPPISLATC